MKYLTDLFRGGAGKACCYIPASRFTCRSYGGLVQKPQAKDSKPGYV